MAESFQLSLEQEFNLRSFSEKVKGLSHEEAQEFLVSLYELMIRKESMYKHFLKQEWGLSSSPSL
ncbi:NblA/ycf18 family protein [Lyngbya confervoides]|uniref:NblA/ycf18 family protein n=1 Tax=Lyngbya confervoides BDU141951 TaxID=1574623 RepID=A0ABD4SYI1_9CYAN|nr:NblA/ycf18 family protein [Lyngbya confervoides]MCM1981474.1 NblA/ycf18 family protein [Lyngbya confervoides BDU141951]